ncbi:segregation and condensation protein A [Faecalibaculum rodentium]|uniref:segregation and condensation protein A n=1 Tax=Faecalibaculum rodentium TaxID=1702221 RepID=UPI0025A50ECD|nr:segregation/condensation protein A [Faecalibaculum rodentium]
MEFLVALNEFEGPLDLMLHLVRQHKLDLHNLNMAELADQYICYLQSMADLHLEIASEYLEELALLVEYKSRMLLPRQKDDQEDDYEEDRRQDLVRRLLEYQAYKEAAQMLSARYEERTLLLSRAPDSRIREWSRPVEETWTGTGDELAKAMERVLRRYAVLVPHETRVRTRELSTGMRRQQILHRLPPGARTSLRELCSDCTDVHMVVVTFLALLDLLHEGLVQAVQNEEDIRIYRPEGEAGTESGRTASGRAGPAGTKENQ